MHTGIFDFRVHALSGIVNSGSQSRHWNDISNYHWVGVANKFIITREFLVIYKSTLLLVGKVNRLAIWNFLRNLEILSRQKWSHFKKVLFLRCTPNWLSCMHTWTAYFQFKTLIRSLALLMFSQLLIFISMVLLVTLPMIHLCGRKSSKQDKKKKNKVGA